MTAERIQDAMREVIHESGSSETDPPNRRALFYAPSKAHPKLGSVMLTDMDETFHPRSMTWQLEGDIVIAEARSELERQLGRPDRVQMALNVTHYLKTDWARKLESPEQAIGVLELTRDEAEALLKALMTQTED